MRAPCQLNLPGSPFSPGVHSPAAWPAWPSVPPLNSSSRALPIDCAKIPAKPTAIAFQASPRSLPVKTARNPSLKASPKCLAISAAPRSMSGILWP